MKIKKGDFVIIDVDSVNASPQKGKSQEKNKDGTGIPNELQNAPSNIEKPELEIGGKSGPGYERSGTVNQRDTGKKYTSHKALGSGGTKAEASALWENALRSAIASGAAGLSEKAKRLLNDLKSSKPKVDWKKELKKFMDSALGGWEDVLPNKRFLSGGDVIYGTRPAGKDTLRTLVLPVDTSGSISKDQIGTFLGEVFSLSTKFEIDVVYIVYCSDSIDSIDVVPKGKKPDLSMIRSTGGNREGFFPPFRFIQEPKKYQGKANLTLPKKIVPSAVIYFTDTFAEYPTRNDFGIAKYSNKVFWFICLSKDKTFNQPPFGRYIHMPIDSKGNFT